MKPYKNHLNLFSKEILIFIDIPDDITNDIPDNISNNIPDIYTELICYSHYGVGNQQFKDKRINLQFLLFVDFYEHMVDFWCGSTFVQRSWWMQLP